MRSTLGLVLWFAVAAQAACAVERPCKIARTGASVELVSPHFILRLDTAAGLNAQSWLNRRTGRTMSLGGGPELRLEIGDPASPQPLKLRVTRAPALGIALPPGNRAEPFQLKITTTLASDVDWRYKAHFVPKRVAR